MRPDAVLLLDMKLAAGDAVDILAGLALEQFEQDRFRQLASVKAVEIVGEAASRLSDDFIRQHPELPWADIIGMRHRLVHDYFGIDYEQVWKTVKEDIPGLIELLEQWIAQEEQQ